MRRRAEAAAARRQEPYNTRDDHSPTRTQRHQPTFAGGLTAEDIEKLQKPNVKRLANVTQLYFLDYYFDLLNYTHQRQRRLQAFKAHNPPPNDDTPAPEADKYQALLKDYLGRERTTLRQRRTRMKHGDFQMLTQIGRVAMVRFTLLPRKTLARSAPSR